MTFGGIAAAGAAVIAGAVYEVPRLFKRRASGHYADLVNRLDNPEQAAALGRAFKESFPSGDTLAGLEDKIAPYLRTSLTKKSLPELIARDAADPRLIGEVGGWVMPATLISLCVMADESL
jgi:hypothetical protein